MLSNILRATGISYMKDIWGWFDLIYILLNGVINAVNIQKDLMEKKDLRLIQSVLSITIIVKLLYFMQLIDQIAPLVKIIQLIFGDIGWFMVIFLVAMFGFSTSFRLLG